MRWGLSPASVSEGGASGGASTIGIELIEPEVVAGERPDHRKVVDATIALEINEMLYEQGEPRRSIYRIEQGALCVFRSDQGGLRDVVEFAVTGDVVGLGSLGYHVTSAEAISPTWVVELSADQAAELIAKDPQVALRCQRAIAYEIEVRRAELSAAGRSRPVERVAAFLSAVSDNNRREGRDPTVVTDSLRCGLVAEMLSMTIAELGQCLAVLEQEGLIRPGPNGELRLLDVPALDDMARQS